MQAHQRVGSEPVGVVDGEAPAEPLAPTGQLLAAGGVEQAVLVAEHFGAAGGQLVAGLGIGEFGAAGIGEGFLGRVGDLDQVGAHAVAGEHVEPCHGFLDRIEEIADDDDVAEAPDIGEVGLGRQVAGMHQLGGDAFGAVAGGEGIGEARPGDALAAARQQFGHGQRQHQRARLLGNAGAGRFVEHGRRGVGPQPDRMGGFPFAVAHIGVVVARRAAPVDARGIAFDIGPELPEILADAALAAAMPAGDHGVDDAARLDQQVGHKRSPQPATGERVTRRCRSLDLADARH